LHQHMHIVVLTVVVSLFMVKCVVVVSKPILPLGGVGGCWRFARVSVVLLVVVAVHASVYNMMFVMSVNNQASWQQRLLML